MPLNVLPQLHNILAHYNPRPFAGNLEGQEFGADEDVMTGDMVYHSTGKPAHLCTLTNTLIPSMGLITLPPTANTPTLSHTYPHHYTCYS